MLQSMGSQRVRHSWAAEQQQYTPINEVRDKREVTANITEIQTLIRNCCRQLCANRLDSLEKNV